MTFSQDGLRSALVLIQALFWIINPCSRTFQTDISFFSPSCPAAAAAAQDVNDGGDGGLLVFSQAASGGPW